MTIKKVPNLEDFQFQPSVKDKDLSSPPGSPAKGHRYIVDETGSGDWAGETDNIAIYNGTTWDFVTVVDGFLIWVEDENKFYKYTGTKWKSLISSGGIIL